MKMYAYVIDGRVQEVIPDVVSVDGIDVAISDRYTPEFVAALIECDESVSEGMAYSEGTFSLYVAPAPTPAEILAQNTAMRDLLISQASLAMAPLQDAVDLDEATADETALLKQWKLYRVAVNRVDLTVQDCAWPARPA